ncbi:MAG: nuclear transport factor 2 family protein [Rhodocyclales bacterium GT-UBC]|nr:MAG: nuclear transport factor 2 family protein [Rhodocyclales bacterium GT-UBC]
MKGGRIMNADQPATIEQHLLVQEALRARCLIENDFSGLEALLSAQLIHVHASGRLDDRAGYLRFVRDVAQVLELGRGPLALRHLGDGVVLMCGRQTNRSRGRVKGDEVCTVSQVSQLWVAEGDGLWRLAVFHATALGPA